MLWLLLLSLFIPRVCFAQYAPTLGPTETPAPTIQPTVTTSQLLTPTPGAPTAAPTEAPAPTLIPTPTVNPAFDIFEKYKNDYLFQRDQYAAAYADYISKKNVDTKFSTLNTQQDLLESSKVVTVARNNMVKAYLMVISVDLDKYKLSNFDQTNKYQDDLLSTEKWLDTQNLVVAKIDTNAGMKSWVIDFKKQYINIQKIAFGSMVLSDINRNLYGLNQMKAIIQGYRSSSKYNAASGTSIDDFYRQTDVAMGYLNDAFKTTQKNQNSKFSNFYPDAELLVGKANNTLKSMSTDLKFILSNFAQ
ncbi:MAG TPA: hypothetical protein VF828_01950 [Patescibacteria group bacterium]